jgi:Rad3-related DNA helicase
VFEDLGHTIMRIAEKTPGGILMFFPSYRLMELCYETWKDYDIINKIDKIKTLLKEPKDPS